jgi:hypothetical protein
MSTYRKKPVVVEAWRWDGLGAEPRPPWLESAINAPRSQVGAAWARSPTNVSQMTLAIRTLEGVMTASLGDWIIQGVKGELYPCKPDIFEATYEKVED